MKLGICRECSQLEKAGLIMMVSAFAFAFAMSETSAAEPVMPAGYITIARDVPAHNAFRAGDIGQPTNVATAREDVVVASTRLGNQVPQPLADSALDRVGSLPSDSAQFNPGSNNTVANPGSAMRGIGAILGRTTSSIESGVVQAMPGGASTRALNPALSPIGNTLSAMPGIR
jgi:hypothetical protein